MKKIILLIAYTLFALNLMGQELPRRATWQAKISWPTTQAPGARITEIEDGSPLDNAGLQSGDLILSVDGRAATDGTEWGAINYQIRANRSIPLLIKRNHQQIQKTVQLNPLPKEKHNNVDTYYESVVSDYGINQRTIVTVPKGKSREKNPAIFLVQGLSCSSVEKYSERSNNWVRVIQDLAEKSGMVLMRVEKPGVGDSEGDCGKVDFTTELNGYESALAALKDKPYVDTSQIIVYGNSMGSAIAPYLANKYNLAGVISDGTFYKSWYEHMLEIERRILGIEGKSEEEIYDLMNTVYIPLYYEMLVKKRSYHEILQDNPTWEKHHRQGMHHMYGRPMAYYHQLQDFNFAKGWEQVKVPVRIRWGTNDWIMSEEDNDMIIQVLGDAGHQDHELYKFDGLDHWSTIHPDYSSSFYFKPGKWEDKISQQIIDWAWDIIEK